MNSNTCNSRTQLLLNAAVVVVMLRDSGWTLHWLPQAVTSSTPSHLIGSRPGRWANHRLR